MWKEIYNIRKEGEGEITGEERDGVEREEERK